MSIPKINTFSSTFSFSIERLNIQLNSLQKKVAIIALAIISCIIIAASCKMIKDFYNKKSDGKNGNSIPLPTNDQQTSINSQTAGKGSPKDSTETSSRKKEKTSKKSSSSSSSTEKDSTKTSSEEKEKTSKSSSSSTESV